MFDLAILGLLSDGPQHGYQIRRRLLELGFGKVSFGSLYPAIRRLEKKDLIVADKSGGRRKTYHISETGRGAFDDLVATGSEDGDERHFRMQVAFFSHLAPARRIRVLRRRRSALVTRLAEMRASRRSLMAGDPYRVALLERSIGTTESEIGWLDELIAAERSTGDHGLPITRGATVQ